MRKPYFPNLSHCDTKVGKHTDMSSCMSSPDRDYLTTIPWCATLLNDPNWSIIPTTSRIQKPDHEDEFFSRTLATTETISAFVTQIRRRAQRVERQSSVTAPGSSGWQPTIIEARALFALSTGVNGYPNIAHGGFVASLLDEIMGILITTNKDEYEETGTDEQNPQRLTTVTAELNIKYRRPVFTGGVVVARAWFDEIQGTRFRLQATIEDSEGRVLSEGAGLFVGLKRGSSRNLFRAGTGSRPKI